MEQKMHMGSNDSSVATQEMNERMQEQMEECLQNCIDCYTVCTETAQHCLHTGGEHARPEHIRILADCASICQLSADFMLRSSQWHTAVCEVCAQICEECAQDCARFDADEFMLECAEICRQCASSCREMVGMSG